MKKIDQADELWPAIEALGDRRSFYLLEQFVAGDVFHVDSIVWDRQVVFQAMHQYGAAALPGGARRRHLHDEVRARTDPAWAALETINRDVLTTFGIVRGVAHTEFIRSAADGRFLFLETSARVGGAFIVDLVEAETGLNLWREWAKLEMAGEEGHYTVPAVQNRSAALLLTLARQDAPDTSAYADPEIVFRVTKPNHAGLIVASQDQARVEELLRDYSERFATDFYAFAPAPERPPDVARVEVVVAPSRDRPRRCETRKYRAYLSVSNAARRDAASVECRRTCTTG